MPPMIWRSLFFPKPRHLIRRLAVIVGALPIIGWIGGSYWVFDLFNHFQFQYAVFLSLCTVVLLGMKAFREGAIAAALLMVPFVRIAPSYLPPAEVALFGTPVRVASFNVFVSNHRHEDTLRWVLESNPDFIYFTETTDNWATALEALGDTYPHSVEEGSGFAFYSKLPITRHEIIGTPDPPGCGATHWWRFPSTGSCSVARERAAGASASGRTLDRTTGRWWRRSPGEWKFQSPAT